VFRVRLGNGGAHRYVRRNATRLQRKSHQDGQGVALNKSNGRSRIVLLLTSFQSD
jgi:hypothetical protein